MERSRGKAVRLPIQYRMSRSSAARNSEPRLHQHQYKLERQIGSGTFGSVFKATADDGAVVAIKRVQRVNHFEIGREICVNLMINHPNIVQMKDVFFTVELLKSEDCLTHESSIIVQNMVFEWLPMNLFQYNNFHRVSMKSIPPSTELWKIARDVLLALDHLHSLTPAICHRDLKLDNILLDLDPFIAKLCDFGSSKAIEPGEKVFDTVP